MAAFAVRRKVDGLVKAAVLAAYPSLKIAFENNTFTQPKGEHWIDITYAPGQSMRKNLGRGPRRVFRHMGIVVINIMAPEEEGTVTLDGLRDVVFKAVADRKFNLGADGYLTLVFPDTRNRGTLNGFRTYCIQVEYHHDENVPSPDVP